MFITWVWLWLGTYCIRHSWIWELWVRKVVIWLRSTDIHPMFKWISNERKLPEYARVDVSCYTLVGSDSTQVRDRVPQRVCQQQQRRGYIHIYIPLYYVSQTQPMLTSKWILNQRFIGNTVIIIDISLTNAWSIEVYLSLTNCWLRHKLSNILGNTPCKS